MLRPAMLVALAGLLALTGCGDDTKTVVSTQTVTRGNQTTADSDAQRSGERDTTSEAPTRVVHRSMFRTPTGNIGCAINASVARCDIGDRNWSPPRPAGCPDDSDFGQGLEVSKAGEAEVVCAGDTARAPQAPVLPYGTGSEVGSFLCVSRSSGVTCTNRRTGHGFLINAERYRLF